MSTMSVMTSGASGASGASGTTMRSEMRAKGRRPRGLSVAVCLFVLAVTAVAGAPPVAAQRPVGQMVLVVNEVRGTPPGRAAAPMAVGEGVVLDHLIETGPRSAARLTIGDHGVIRMGQSTRQRIDRHEVDQATGEERSVFSVLLGKVQVALDSLFGGELTVETPSASLGVKGTVFRVLVDAVGRTVVAVLEGVVEVTAKAGGTVTLTAGTYTVVDPGGAPLPPAPFDPTLGTLSPSAGGPDFEVPGEELLGETPLLDGERFDLPRQPPGQRDPDGLPQGLNDPNGDPDAE